MRKAHLLAALALPLGLAVACQSQTVGQAPLEDDPVFVGAEKTVVSPVGEPWTMFYFANETQDSLKDKLAGAAFFSSLGFEPFEKLATGRLRHDFQRVFDECLAVDADTTGKFEVHV